MRWPGSWRNRRCMTEFYAAPGNPGIAEHATLVAIDIEDHDAVAAFCKEKAIDFVVVGPEAPLVAGLADRLRADGIAVFGPSAAAAQLEGSKGFTKDICARYNIPTGAYQRFNNAPKAKAYIRAQGAPIVVKADGLAAGKGVTVAMTVDEALAAVDDCFDGAFGAAGAEVVIEAYLDGEEASFFCLCDGKTRAGARLRAGPQARRRRRHRPEHRRHGRLLPRAGDDAGDGRAHDEGNHRADDPRHGRKRPSLLRRASSPG